MIPVPAAVKAKILDWLPKTLGGYEYPTKETDNIVPDLIAPAITYYFSSVSSVGDSYQLIRTVKNANMDMDDYWGEHYYATMNVVLRATDKDELATMWEDFLRKCPMNRRDLNINVDGVRFVEILNAKPLQPQRLEDGSDLFWAQIDLKFEYEVSDVSEADYIRQINVELEVRSPDHSSYIYWESHLFEQSMNVAIRAYIAPLQE
jgi:hypothetical protein